MGTHNIGFYEDLTKIICKLLSITHLISSVNKATGTCLRLLSRIMIKPGFLTRSRINRAVQQQKKARGLKF